MHNTFKEKATLHVLFGVVLVLFLFRGQFFNPHTNLHDNLDYPYYVWVIDQNLDDIKSLNFSHLFDTNSYYPNKGTLFLSDTLLTQSITALPFSFFSSNPILIFNLTLALTLILNFISTFVFWKGLFKENALSFIGTFLILFSPFFHSQTGHFQMITVWPYFLSLYFFLKSADKSKYTIISGVFFSLQFLASVYLSIFLAASLVIISFVKALQEREFSSYIKRLITVFFIFLVLCGVFIKGYIDTNNEFGIGSSYEQQVKYSTHLTDYLFPNKLNTAIYSLKPFEIWNSFNKHPGAGAFPGILVSTIVVFTLFTFSKTKNYKLSLTTNTKDLPFFILLVTSLIFSLGPRLNVNGFYAYIPLPYHIIAKYVPFVNSMRAPSRWTFVVYFALTFLVLSKLSTIIKYKSIVMSLVLILVFLEYYPLSMPSASTTTQSKELTVLQEACKDLPRVVLYIPVTHYGAGENIVEGLDYITQVLLASTQHNCKLINGYSGHDPQYLIDLDIATQIAIKENDIEIIENIINTYNTDLVIFDKTSLHKDVLNYYDKFVEDNNLKENSTYYLK